VLSDNDFKGIKGQTLIKSDKQLSGPGNYKLNVLGKFQCMLESLDKLHHSVGSSIREMTPNFSILVNSALTLSISGNGTLRGTDNANGFASGYNTIVYVQFVFPSSLKFA
jgi:hypothetical protein